MLKKLSIISVFFLLLTSCGVFDSDNKENVTFSGKLSSTLQKSSVVQKPVADQVWGFRFYKNELALGDFIDGTDKGLVIANINSDGSFSIELPNDNNDLSWVLVLVNSKAENKFDGVIGYVALENVSDDYKTSLIQLPTSELDTSRVDLGNITQPNDRDEAIADLSTDVYATEINMTADQLFELAEVDNQLRFVKNCYTLMNYKEKSSIIIQPSYSWEFEGVGKTNISTVTNNIISPDLFDFVSAKKGFSIYIESSDGTKDTSYDIIPPAPLSEDMFYFKDDKGNIRKSFSADTTSWNLLAGKWTLKLNSTVKGYFELGSEIPLDSKERLKFYVPSVDVRTNTAKDTVVGVDISWYYYSRGKYVKVTDYSAISKSIGNVYFSVDKKQNWHNYFNAEQKSPKDISFDLTDYNIPYDDVSVGIAINTLVAVLHFSWSH